MEKLSIKVYFLTRIILPKEKLDGGISRVDGTTRASETHRIIIS